jgi:uncharacterized membrane protein
MMPFCRLPALFAFTVLAHTAAPAHAAFLFCNRTQTPIEAAFGYRDDIKWQSEGWWQIQPGQCARVYSRPLTQRFYFYFARALTAPSANGKQPTTWGGKYRFCIDGKAFRIEGDGKCEPRGYQEKGFQEVDIGANQHDYTLNFEDGTNH